MNLPRLNITSPNSGTVWRGYYLPSVPIVVETVSNWRISPVNSSCFLVKKGTAVSFSKSSIMVALVTFWRSACCFSVTKDSALGFSCCVNCGNSALDSSDSTSWYSFLINSYIYPVGGIPLCLVCGSATFYWKDKVPSIRAWHWRSAKWHYLLHVRQR